MTISNLLLLVLVLVFSPESMAERGCAKNNAAMLWGDQCALHSHEVWASWWKPGVRPPPRAPRRFFPSSYDERLLVLQWPPTYCNKYRINCGHLYQKFTVHGLWFNRDSKPVCCHLSNAPPIRFHHSLLPCMERQWPNLNCPGDSEYFWQQEYSKHGSCVKGFRNPELYFLTALDILKQIGEVTTMLLHLPERPPKPLKTGELYQVKEFEHVTIGGKRFFPSLRCSRTPSSPFPQLLEIVFCTNRRKEQRRCTPTVQNCNSNEWFLFPRVPDSLSGSSRSPP